MRKYRILKTFIYGEKITLSMFGIKQERVFIRVTFTHLTLLNAEGNEEDIELDNISSIEL